MKELMDAKHAMMLSKVGKNDSARLVMTVLTTARRIDADCSELLARHDLSEGRFAVLLGADEEDGVTPAQLAERLDVSRATVTGLVDGLERQGLVTRVADPADRRSFAVRLTSAGQHLISDLVPIYRAWLFRLAADIAEGEHSTSMQVVGLLQHNPATHSLSPGVAS